MKVERFIVGPLATNCYLITCDISQQSVIVDPGGVSEELLQAAKRSNIAAILLTHGHFDHIQGVESVAEITGAPVNIHELDACILTDSYYNGSFMIGVEIRAPEVSGFLHAGKEVSFGESTLKVVHSPGHTAGSVSFVADDHFVIGGDTLFRLSIGRWDLPGGDYNTLIKTLKTTYCAMSDSMILYPGHGEISTIGFEKAHNQFLQ